ncbi:uncharacterized protein LOC135834500 isoform X18 [Planococcus citri]|uniref:uncharacterized protein LOC135834500 isoform X18 n=1 Tax=Planococcus citri TaxID=170843 RepID=UPI0031F8B52F
MVSNVFDLTYPSPATLQEISSSALVSALWHWEVENRTNDDFEKLLRYSVLCKNLPPNMPSPITDMIEVYIERFISSLYTWLSDHYSKLFSFHRNDEFHILHDFYDFSCGRFGKIHSLRTARRMMVCDRLSNEEKFKIACMYCFEDDIRRIWPSVSENLDLDEIDFDGNAELIYWLCMLRNEPDRIPNPDDNPDDDVNDVMLRGCLYPPYHWTSVLYFWNRIRPENRLEQAIYLSKRCNKTFVRFILHTLSDQELDKFVAERGALLMHNLLINNFDGFPVFPTWMYIKNKMTESNFPRLIELLIRSEINYDFSHDLLYEGVLERLYYSPSTEDRTYPCCEVWRSSPDELKRSAIKYILTRDQLFIRERIRPAEIKEVMFLLIVLSDASFEERNDFWHKNWRDVMVDMRLTDLHRLMKLCFKDENEITRFKETSMAEYGNIGAYCNVLMKLGYFEKLNDFLIFCCTDTNKRKVIKQLVTQSCVSDDSLVIKERHLIELELMNEFINDASDNAETACNFKNAFASFRRVEDLIDQCTRSSHKCTSDHLIHFIETFVQTEEVTVTLKQDILNHVRDYLIDGYIYNVSVDDLQSILLWCLGNDDEVANFKLSLSTDDVFRIVGSEARLFALQNENRDFWKFLMWYFRTTEEMEEFERGFADQS